ncbi:zinc finger protein weckle-like isoform X1 [Drosophila ficusphila]|uniref:zinc finger protein weckle-like isoform X1 n=1 Tax=Drosophila ficusphila TaxID=30025 RepID=UPI0007E83E6F|nr:zinc finger protein weckle-like isoform X1 [Drosophila ficusphila]
MTKCSNWLTWCRLCAKDDAHGNVQVQMGENGQGTWDNLLIIAIHKYFEVHMLKDELSIVLCAECYTLISKLINFTEHVTKVQAIFEVLQRSETVSNKHLDLAALRQQYGLGEDDWTHIIKHMQAPEMDSPLEPNMEDILEMELTECRDDSTVSPVAQEQDVKSELLDSFDDDTEFLPEETQQINLVITAATGNSQEPNAAEPTKRRHMNCEKCGKVYKNRTSYEKHLERKCQNAKTYICDTCGKQLKTTTALKEHYLVHTDNRPFKCSVCTASFKNQARLKAHHQIHEEPSFVCNICGKKLHTRGNLKKHKVMHSEERRLKCDVCGALFKRSKTFKNHLLSHTGLRPYVCNYCEKSFTTNYNCRLHKLKKHPQEVQQENGENLSSRLNVRLPTLEELHAISTMNHLHKG